MVVACLCQKRQKTLRPRLLARIDQHPHALAWMPVVVVGIVVAAAVVAVAATSIVGVAGVVVG